MVEQAADRDEISREEQPFAKCAFGDERRRLARMFTSYFDRTDSTLGYVANLNGEWGTGKTFFVTEWSRKLKKEDYGVVFIDAWKSDYLDDPLSIVVAEVLQQLTNQLKTSFDVHDIQELTNGILKTSGGLIKAFLPILTKAVGNKFLGEESVELLIEFIGGTKEFLDQDNPKSLNYRLGEFGKLAFSAHKRHGEFSNNFKNELQKLINLTAEKSRKKKVYIFIDELDRCRPTYAIEMLETIKHLFDIKNLVFIISTDTAQLEHSIKAVYGNGFDSFEYLHRFFKQRITLPKPDYYKFLCMEKTFESIDFSYHHFYPKIDSADKIRALVALQSETNGVELRKMVNICSQIETFLVNIEHHQRFTIDIIFLTVALFTINMTNNPDDIYQSIKDPLRSTGKIKVTPICIGKTTQHNSQVEYFNLAMDIISEYDNLDRIRQGYSNQRKLSLNRFTQGAATVLFNDLGLGNFNHYEDELITKLNDDNLKLLSNKELLEMINCLKITDLFVN